MGTNDWIDQCRSHAPDARVRRRGLDAVAAGRLPPDGGQGTRRKSLGKPGRRRVDVLLRVFREYPFADTSRIVAGARGGGLRGLLRDQAWADARRLVLKWPNDIQFDDAKLAGILVETAFQSGTQGVTVVAGIGLNLRGGKRLALSLGRAVADWESVPKPGSVDPAAADIVAAIARAWVGAVGDYARAGYAVFQPRFDQLDALAGTHVEVIDQGRTIQGGIACGTDPEGRLMLSTPQGRFPVLVGDVSVRPQSGGGKRQS